MSELRTRAAPPLDAEVARLGELAGRRAWDRAGVGGLLAFPAAALLVSLIAVAGPELPSAALVVVFEAVVVGVTALAARPLVRRLGGWRTALGLSLPTWRDLPTVLGWSALLFGAQALVLVLLQGFVPELRDDRPDNASYLGDLGGAALALQVAVTVAVAPVVEELLFRGLLLRWLLLRLGFWPAAALTSAVFGLLHAASVDGEGLLLVTATAVVGLGLCLLTRRTVGLGPGIGVHALRNAMTVAVVLLVL